MKTKQENGHFTDFHSSEWKTLCWKIFEMPRISNLDKWPSVPHTKGWWSKPRGKNTQSFTVVFYGWQLILAKWQYLFLALCIYVHTNVSSTPTLALTDPILWGAWASKQQDYYRKRSLTNCSAFTCLTLTKKCKYAPHYVGIFGFFPATQILRQIIFEEIRMSEIIIF